MSKDVFVYGECNKTAFEQFQQDHTVVDWNTFFTNTKEYKNKQILLVQDDTTHKILTREVVVTILKQVSSLNILACPLYRVSCVGNDNVKQRFLTASKLDIVHTFTSKLFTPNIQFYIKDGCVHKELYALSDEEAGVFTTLFYLIGENLNDIAKKYDLEPGIVELLGFIPTFMSKNPDINKLKTYFTKNKYTLFYNSQKHILYIDQKTSDGKIPNEIKLGDIKDEIITSLSDHIRNFGLDVFDLYFNKKGSSKTEEPHTLSLWNCYNLFKLIEKQHRATYDKIDKFSDMTKEELEFYCFNEENRWVITSIGQKELERIFMYRNNEQLFRNDKLKSMYA